MMTIEGNIHRMIKDLEVENEKLKDLLGRLLDSYQEQVDWGMENSLLINEAEKLLTKK